MQEIEEGGERNKKGVEGLALVLATWQRRVGGFLTASFRSPLISKAILSMSSRTLP